MITDSFANASAPEDVALALSDGLRDVYPDDASLQRMIAGEWADALRKPHLSAHPTPASPLGAHTYQINLAEALTKPVASARRGFDPIYTMYPPAEDASEL